MRRIYWNWNNRWVRVRGQCERGHCDDLVQDCDIFSTLAIEIQQSCTHMSQGQRSVSFEHDVMTRKCFLAVVLTIFRNTVNALNIGPRSLSDKNWEGLTGCPHLSMLNYWKNQCMSNKTEILNALTGNISYMNLQSKLKIMLSRKCFLKMLPAKWPLFCSGLNVWKYMYVSICFVCRVAIQENIDIIKLQREVKEKSTKLTALQGQYANLEEVSVHWLNSLRPGSIFYPSALRAGGVLSSRSGRAGGRLPNLRNLYLCNRLKDFLHSKFCGIV